MEQEALDDQEDWGTEAYFSTQAKEAGLEELLQQDQEAEQEELLQQQEEEEEEELLEEEEEEYAYDEDEDEYDIKQDMSVVSDDDIEEVSRYSPQDATRLTDLKSGQGALDSYLIHQQGRGGYNQIMSGNMSAQVRSNMRNNLPKDLKNVPAEKLKETFVGYWRNRLGTIKVQGTQEERAAITKAAIDNGEDPDKWLRIAQVESSFNKNAVSPSGRHKGYFQIDSSYLNNPALLADPYQSTVMAIRHNKNEFKGNKLDYKQLGGSQPWNNPLQNNIKSMPISSSGYTPVGNIPLSNPNTMFGGKYFTSDTIPYSDPNSKFAGASLNSKGTDPSGVNPLAAANPILSAVDSIGGTIVENISGVMKGVKNYKGLIGQGVDSAVTGISSILSEKQNQRNYMKTLERQYGEGSYGEGPLDA